MKHQRNTQKREMNNSSIDWSVARWMLIIRPAVVTATLGVAILVLPQKTPLVIVVSGIYILTLLYWMAHYFSGISRSLLATQIAFDIFIITVIIHYTGGYESSFVGFYLLSIMCASLFFRRLITFLFSSQAAAFYILYLFVVGPRLDSSFLFKDVRVGVFQALLYCILMFSIGFLSSYFAEKLRGKDTSLTNVLRLLKEAKLDTSDILQSMTNGLITFDTAGRMMYINRVAESILQIDHEFVVGKTLAKVFFGRTSALAKFLNQQLITTFYSTGKEIEVFNKKGSVVPIGLTSMPLYDTDGSRRGFIVNFKDLTEKKKLLEMIRQSERMAAIGELSAAIAHEIRNPLASIGNAAEILSDCFEDKDPQVSKLLDVIEKESERLQRISTDFLRFARIKSPDIKTLNLSKAIENVLVLIDNDPRKTDDIIIKNSIKQNTLVLFDVDHLQQLMINIIINSMEALNGQGEIEFSCENQKGQSENYIRLTISDNGPGFPEEALGNMFEPFFSTKKDGTGLGLAMVRKIAFSNHGRVFASNNDSGGAEVTMDIHASGDE